MKKSAWLIPAALLCVAAAEPNPVRLNQLGFLPAGAKRAMLADASPVPLPWKLVDASGRAIASGRTIVFGEDGASGEHVHRVDLGASIRPGKGYRLQIAGKSSRAFAVDAGIYDRLPYAALNYFYQSRAGTPIEARYAGGAAWARPAGHAPEKASCVSGKDPRGNAWDGCPYTLDVTGGWYDAGDQGKYLVNGGIALWTLLASYERQGPQGSAFRDGKAALPEAGNKVDDLLDEARWEMEFFLAMQVPEGTRMRLPVGVKRAAPGLVFTGIDASGMAHHKVADEHWTALPTPPHLDREKRLLFPPSTGATLNLAATAAQCARIWRSIDPAFSARCLAAAERAWAAAKRNPEVYAIAQFGGSGGYGDGELSDEFYWAAAELFVTTGKPEYERAVRSSSWFSAPVAEPSWPQVAALGTLTLTSVKSRLPAGEVADLKARLVEAADLFLADRAKNGYGVPYAPSAGYPWGSTSSILNRAILLARAYDFTGKVEYRDGVIDAMDFILGRNPLDRSFVSGFGARPMENPHHRFWTHQLDPKLPGPPAGVLSGGPNSTSLGSDPVGREMKGKCAPQTCWADDARAFSMNEVAINWNAPLVWVSAWLAERRQARG
jgi:endoglucanase